MSNLHILFYLFLTLYLKFTQSASNSSTSRSSSTSTTPHNLDEVFKAALKDITYYLRQHKFNEYDRRYEPNLLLARREYFGRFPRPPLRSLHWEVHKNCFESFLHCVHFLVKKVRQAGLRREDDTSVVVHEQKWEKNHSQQVDIVEKDCRRMRDLDDGRADPFEGPLERYQWRTTASYYMCWYTMKSEPGLEHIEDRCDNFAYCLDPVLGSENGDVRADDKVSFGCALYSFCPDPCCPLKRLGSLEECWEDSENPCWKENSPGKRQCRIEPSKNLEFADLVLNRWNVSCSCSRKGFEWSSLYGHCVDVNECALGTHSCQPETEVCLNLPGSFRCACRWGHKFDASTGKCAASDALTSLVLHEGEVKNETEKVSLWLRFMRLFASSGECNAGHMFVVGIITLSAVVAY